MKCNDVAAELRKVRQHLKMARHTRWRRSRLERYRSELVALHRAGASLRELATWLRIERRCVVAKSTICRYLSKLPELQERK